MGPPSAPYREGGAPPKPWGVGEPSAAVVPSAISNAVFDATGARLRSVPYTPDKVRSVLRGA
jgi:nicotinate dehydrogenase subunit B